jgi:uncharacterized protein (TIGR02996 family)
VTDEASFLAAIAENPADANLPLIFADWLDDHGDPRGQWIRQWAVRQWMHPTYESPLAKMLDALAKDRSVIKVRRAAAVIGEPIVPGLVALLAHEKPRVRQQACHCLRNIGPRAKEAVTALMKALADSDYSVREQAAKALAAIGADETAGTDQLKAALTDSNWSVRRTASKVLGAMGAKGSVLDELVERYESPDRKDRIDVIEGLAQLGTADVIAHLDKAIDDPEGEVRVAAIRALGRLRLAGAVAPLCRAMRDGDAAARECAAEQFTGYGRELPRPPEVIDALTALLSDRANVVRATACRALVRTGRAAARAAPALLANLDHDAAHVRTAAAEALGHVVRDDATVIAALTKLLADPELNVALNAVTSLGCQTKLPDAVIEPLFALLRRLRADEGNDYRVSHVFTAFGRLANPPAAVIDELRRAVATPPPPNHHDHGWNAANALAALGPAAAPAVPELLAALRADRNGSVAIQALLACGEAGITGAAALFDDPDERVRNNGLNMLWRVGVAALPLLPAVLRCLDRTAEDWRRMNVVRAVQYIGPSATAAIPALIGAARAGGRNTTSAALTTLRTYGAALVPHLPELLALANELGSDYRSPFAEMYVAMAAHTPGVLEPVRVLLRGALPAEADDWNTRWAKRSVREAAIRALALMNTGRHIADPGAVAADLAPLVEDPEPEVRRATVRFVGALHTPAVVAPLCRALADTDDFVRQYAAEVLAIRGDNTDDTLAALVHAVGDRAPKVRRAAVDALNKLKASTETVRAALASATEDDDPKVAERARVALNKATPKAAKPTKPKGAKRTKE